ncbi:hypothetical protein OHA21_05530 [Actinoplanes sp. NBC_00393]|uniref:hypothetical protein n=1 Tax=Actinoplanes sp. NBC_00393 TaxID=2975953 RepID=UPI002E241144
MPDRSTPKSRVIAPLTIAALTVGWLIGTVSLALVSFWFFMSTWGESPGGGESIESMAILTLVAAVAFVGLGPLAIAGAAYSSGLRRTAVAYLVLAALLFVGAVIQLTVFLF